MASQITLTQTVTQAPAPILHLILRVDHKTKAIAICKDLLIRGLPEKQQALLHLIIEKFERGSEEEHSLYLLHLYLRVVHPSGMEGLKSRVMDLILKSLPTDTDIGSYLPAYQSHWMFHLLEQASPEFQEIADSCKAEPVGLELAVKLTMLHSMKFSKEEWVLTELEEITSTLLPETQTFDDFSPMVGQHQQEFETMQKTQTTWQAALQDLCAAGAALEQGHQSQLHLLTTLGGGPAVTATLLGETQAEVESVAQRLAKFTGGM